MAISTENIELLAKDKSLEALKLLLESFKEKYGMTTDELLNIMSGKQDSDDIPIEAFAIEKLSSLEIIVKYLKENRNKPYHEIAALLNRDDRTIWSTYNNSIKKDKSKLKLGQASIAIPLIILSNRENSVLESIVIYLKDKQGISFVKISGLLKKDYQTIYTTYRRGREKNAK